MRRQVVAVAAPRESREFAAAALAVLDETRGIASVLVFGVHYWETREDFERWLPRRIGEPWSQRDAPSNSVARASHEVKLAEHGAYYVETPEPARGLPAAQKRLARAEVRANATKEAVAAVLPALRRYERHYLKRWLRERGAMLRALLKDYAVAVDHHQTELDAISTEPWSVGQLRENSACALVRLIANKVVEILDARERGDWLAAASIQSDNLPIWDGWEQLRLVVRREAARLASAPKTDPRSEPARQLGLAGGTSPDRHTDRPSENPGVHDPEGRFFQVSTGFWQVGFGHVDKPLLDGKGMKYLHTLLSKPGEPVHVWVLEHGVEPPPETPSYMVDEPTVESVREDLRIKRAELQEAMDPEAREELQGQIKRMESYLASSISKRGPNQAPRRERTESEKLRESVGKAITKALQQIQGNLPALHEHLAKWIRNPTGMTPCYACPEGERPHWVLASPGVAREP